MSTSPTEEHLSELTMRWDELRRQGRDVSAEDLCVDAPGLVAELGRRIEAVRASEPIEPPATRPAPLSEGARAGPLLPDAFHASATYRPERRHAGGGQGEVLVAHHRELDRRVALKRIRPDRFHEAARQRFLREAAITAGLQHPGIVPIYGLGEDDRGPFYTMPFIEGRTLQEAIETFHREESSRHDPGRGRLELRGLLQRFIAICDTVAYAHDQGVVHRDLKPSNVMLGAYGETLVMDWGLAKRRSGGDTADPMESEPPSPSPSPDDLTAIGAVLGTPRYMSPEQAKGQPAGPASDVFSLGLIQYAILTGKSAFDESSFRGADPLKSVREAAVVPPSRWDPALSRPLEAICLKALAPRPEDRYPSAHALAEDVARWLADEPVSAYAEAMPARLRRWIRQHPRLVTGAAAATLVGVAGLVALVMVVARSNQNIRQKSVEIVRQFQQLEITNRELVKARAEAEDGRDRAREVTEFLVSSFRKPDPAEEGEKVTVAQVLGRAVGELEGRKIAPATRATILNAVGETYHGLGLVSETVDLFEKVLEVRRRHLGEDHPDTLESMSNLALAYSDAGHSDRAIPLYERTLAARRSGLGDDHPDTLTTLNNLAVAYHDAGQVRRAIPVYQEVLRRRQALQGPDHQETLTSLNNLGTAFQDDGRLDLGIPLMVRALEGQRVRMGGDHPETLITLNNLALAYQRAGQFDRAIPLHEQELAACVARQGADHPEALISMNNLATAYLESGRLDRAIPLFERTLRGKEAKLGADHPSVLVTLRNLARAYEKDRRLADAESLYRRAVQAAALRTPRDDLFYSDALGLLGNCLIRQHRAPEAAHFLRESLAIKEKTQPDDWTTPLARSLMGEALAAEGLFDRAEPLLLSGQRGLTECREKMPHKDRDRILRESIDRLVRTYDSWGRPDRARDWRHRVAEILDQTFPSDPFTP